MSALDAPTSALGAGPAFLVELDAFNGPLDLLLHLLREEQVDIADIPIARIAEQFVKAVHSLGLNQAADYLDMASRLLRLKAQMLLPRRLDDDTWEDPRAELVRRLLEYQQIKEIARWLEKSADRRADRHVRGYIPPAPEAPLLPLTLDLIELLRAVERAIHGIPLPIFHKVTARPLDIERATARLQALLDEKDSFDWREALGPAPTIVELLSTFLAILELAKRGGIRVTQNGAFAPLMIARDAALSAA